jgi:hypothetical protein
LLDYGKFSGYGLRKGILGNDYVNALAACITGKESPLPASNKAVRVSVVSSASEYKQAFHIDQKAEASFLGIAGGGEELHFGQENSGSSTAFDIIVEAYGEHDSQTIDNITWDPRYQALLDSGEPAKIQRVREDCGDRYIQTVFNEVRLFAVLHVSKQQSSTLTTFSANAHGKVDIDIVSASAALGGDVNVSSAHKAGALALDIFTEGFGNDAAPPTAAAIGIASADGLDAVATKLSAYLASLHESGQPVKYRLTKLPQLQAGSLSDIQIFDHLNELKGLYFGTYVRMQNMTSLLLPVDPRRILLQQPLADTHVKQQRDKLTTYLTAVEKAHDDCRKALALDPCVASARAVGTPPPRSSVELPLIAPPSAGLYMFAIDGEPVPQGQSSLLFASVGTTLLDAARRIKPSASAVDVLVPIFGGDYLSHIEVIAVASQPPNLPLISSITVGSRRLLAQNLKGPAYWHDAFGTGVALHVLHADVQRPCQVVNSGGIMVIEERCLTSVGLTLRDVALVDAAQYVIKQPPATYNFAMWGSTTNCFGQQSPMPIANVHIAISAKGGEMVAQVGIILPLVNVSLPLIEREESHAPQAWNGIAETRLTALATAGNGPAGSNPCAPHIR